jgi:hypothetical protein
MTTESTQAHEAATDVAPVWRPSPEYISGSHLERLIRALGIDLDVRNPEPAYDALYRRSITSPDEFWRKTFELLGVARARQIGHEVNFLRTQWFAQRLGDLVRDLSRELR